MTIDKIEIVTKYKHLQVRIAESLFDENGNPKSVSYSRETILCGDFEKAEQIHDDVLAVARSLWTPEIIQMYNASITNE